LDVKKLMGVVVVIFVLFWIISQPTSASGSVNSVLGNLREAGNSMVTFLRDVF
jgi:hypothetical protein